MAKAQPIDEALLAELGQWGGPAEMSAFEAVMWRAELDPRLRSTTTSVLVLDRVPEWERFFDDHRWIAAAVPRFRQKVVVPAFRLGHPTWIEDPDFDLHYHVRRMRLPAPGSDRQMLDMAAHIAMTPFDSARGPWEATLIEGLDGGRAAYVLKLHHAVSDGLGIMQLVSRVFARNRETSLLPRPPITAASTQGAATALKLAARHALRSAAALPGRYVGAASVLARGMGGLAKNPASAQRGLRYLGSAKRMMGGSSAKGSPLFRRRSLSRRFDTIEVPLASLKAAAKAVEASLNDAFLSAMIGGFRRYHEEMGVAIDQMPIGFPISLRTGDDPMGGNKFAGSQYAAPVAEKDPVARIRHIQQFVRETRAEPALDIMIRLMPVVTRLPMAAVTRLSVGFTVSQDAQISNIPGIPFPVYLAGAEATHYWPFAPAPGCAMMIAMLSHNGRCCIGINSDRAAVLEPELLVDCLRQGLDEVLALGRPPRPTKRKTRAATR
jgi:diacylglycerol O-acyltransferase